MRLKTATIIALIGSALLLISGAGRLYCDYHTFDIINDYKTLTNLQRFNDVTFTIGVAALAVFFVSFILAQRER